MNGDVAATRDVLSGRDVAAAAAELEDDAAFDDEATLGDEAAFDDEWDDIFDDEEEEAFDEEVLGEVEACPVVFAAFSASAVAVEVLAVELACLLDEALHERRFRILRGRTASRGEPGAWRGASPARPAA